MLKLMDLKEKKGITILALTVTIIILLILAGISIGMLTGENGLIANAGKAKEQAEIDSEKELLETSVVQAMGKKQYGNLEKEKLESTINTNLGKNDNSGAEVTENEENLLVKITSSNRIYLVDNQGNVRKVTWWKIPDENGNNYITNGTTVLQIGDYIAYDANDNGEYTYTAEEEKTGVSGDGQVFSSNFVTAWRLLGVENSSDGDYLILVPETPIQSTLSTGLSLYGKWGYLYGIEELENICDIYGHGTGASYSRAMKIEDVDKITGYNPLNTGDGTIFREGIKNEYNAKITVTKTGYASYSIICSNGVEDTYTYPVFKYFDENRECIPLQIGETVTITNTYYTYYPTTLTENSTGDINGITASSREYSMIFSNNKSYWLASSYDLGGGTKEYISYAYGLFNVGVGYVRNCTDNYLTYAGRKPRE